MAEKREQNPALHPDDEEQSRRFIEDAKLLDVDETGESFDKAFGVVTSSTPKVIPPCSKDEV
ncbi:MAG: hypothetical protein ACYCZR_04095 [Burkholderiales bacterium]